VVLDEAVSALDVSTQAQVLNLLRKLQADSGVGYLFISHDLGVVRQIADDIAVMYMGRVVEQGPADQICGEPRHPYTIGLLASVLRADPSQRLLPLGNPVRGEPPDPANRTPGCSFRSRCRYAKQICATTEPNLRDVGGRMVACHFAGELDDCSND